MYIPIDSSEIENQPFLTQHSFNPAGLTLTAGSSYRIRIGAYNHIAETYSDSVGFLLADKPSGILPPTRLSDGTYLQVLMQKPTDEGGALIENY